MKTTSTLLIYLILPTLTLGQSFKSSFLVSTNFSYKKDNYETVYSNGAPTTNEFTKTISLQPKIGYFILNRVCLGAYMPYRHHVTTIDRGRQTLQDKNLGIGPFVKYYQPIYKKLYGVVNLGFTWTRTSDQFYSFDSTGKIDIYEKTDKIKSSLLGIGFSYFLAKNVAVEFMADYLEEFRDDSGAAPWYYVDHVELNFGLQVYFAK